ncbi:MAG: bifunctional riboflavin kinase/FAD synthetase [Bryobacteraceae bacterium]|nr:bifunctional riboflavin kinase/FAD synthetase [Bryobacteraceae bacterium]
MRIFRNLEEAGGHFGPCALTIGNFDGCHIGHQSIFRQVKAAASENGWKAAVLTFDPHPAKIVAPARAPKLLSTVGQRTRWMAGCGIEEVMILPFNSEVAALDPSAFVSNILSGALRARAVMVGDNFRFGHNQAGDVALLAALGERFGFQSKSMHALRLRGTVVSSSEIRRRLACGDVSGAARMLGRFYFLEGVVIRGHGIGAKQTVPTLNLDTAAEVLPGNGVYVTRTFDLEAERMWPSITNIGHRPTFGGDALAIETFLLSRLDSDPPVRLRVEFTHRLRDERKFDNAALLRLQILKDVERARAWHRRWDDIIKGYSPSRGYESRRNNDSFRR